MRRYPKKVKLGKKWYPAIEIPYDETDKPQDEYEGENAERRVNKQIVNDFNREQNFKDFEYVVYAYPNGWTDIFKKDLKDKIMILERSIHKPYDEIKDTMPEIAEVVTPTFPKVKKRGYLPVKDKKIAQASRRIAQKRFADTKCLHIKEYNGIKLKKAMKLDHNTTKMLHLERAMIKAYQKKSKKSS